MAVYKCLIGFSTRNALVVARPIKIVKSFYQPFVWSMQARPFDVNYIAKKRLADAEMPTGYLLN